MSGWLHAVGLYLGYGAAGLLCLAGLVLSCLSLSGTWLVVGAGVLLALITPSHFPGWLTLAAFGVVALGVELFELVAGAWGVKRRGGSSWAGLAALVGGLGGLVVGGVIPPPLIGNLVGMMLGSFTLAFLVERGRLQRNAPAAHIAFGAVLARVVVLLAKVAVTLAMIGWLVAAALLSR